jgi:dihydrofolate synthase / folylpolyglutamate synthase
MNYPDSVRYLYSLGNEVKSAKFGLETISKVAEALGNPQRACRFVHVAGTNGKGSTCAMIESALRAAGIRTGLYTSPHLAEPTERIQIAGVPVTAAEFAQAFDIVHSVSEGLIRDGVLENHPTYFETVTAMAFVLFERMRAETVVLEVGLGGRLDATNIVTPALSVITRVDFDHEALLGRSIEAIASEKAGILKPCVPAVFAPQRPEAEATLRQRAAVTGSAIFPAADWSVEDCDLDPRGSSFLLRRREGEDEFRVRCPLAGRHQVENALTAAIALWKLGIPKEAIEQGIASTRWPGRLELISSDPEIILDGAHNPSGARALVDYIQRFYGGRKITLIYGAMRDKAVVEMAGILFPAADTVIVTSPQQERATRPETIRELSGRSDARVTQSVSEALQLVRDAEVVFVTGSLFVVAEARPLLTEWKSKKL